MQLHRPQPLHSSFIRPGRSRVRSAFTITELLVVIGIIVVLVGILLPALSAVRGKALMTSTEGTMREFSKACDIYHGDHGNYPGALPDDVVAGLSDPDRISGTENALLALMGGYRVVTPFTIAGSAEDLDYSAYISAGATEVVSPASNGGWGLAVMRSDIGQGPIVNMKPYSPYFSPSGSEVRRTLGQDTLTDADDPTTDMYNLPDLMDRWGQPILYFRASRNTGPIAFDSGAPGVLPQFITATANPYIESILLGEGREDQAELSLLHPDQHMGSGTSADATFAQIIRTPSQGAPDEPLYSTPRGKYVLISAGPDGVYFSRHDGPGTQSAPVTNIVNDPDYGNPSVVKEFDDAVLTGGG
jgi:type II secretory pathway pseudopilin PulG